MSYTLTFGNLATCTVNGVSVTSPYTLKHNDVIYAYVAPYSGDAMYGEIQCYDSMGAAYSFRGTGNTYSMSNESFSLYGICSWKNSPADLTITFTEGSGKESTITYDGSTISQIEESSDVNITYNGSTLASAVTGTKTLKCNGDIMASDVVIGSKTLKCSGKLMESDVIITVE